MTWVEWSIIVAVAALFVIWCVWGHLYMARIDAELCREAKAKLEAHHREQLEILERKWRG
jgi:hypothetical protein